MPVSRRRCGCGFECPVGAHQGHRDREEKVNTVATSPEGFDALWHDITEQH